MKMVTTVRGLHFFRLQFPWNNVSLLSVRLGYIIPGKCCLFLGEYSMCSYLRTVHRKSRTSLRILGKVYRPDPHVEPYGTGLGLTRYNPSWPQETLPATGFVPRLKNPDYGKCLEFWLPLGSIPHFSKWKGEGISQWEWTFPLEVDSHEGLWLKLLGLGLGLCAFLS